MTDKSRAHSRYGLRGVRVGEASTLNFAASGAHRVHDVSPDGEPSVASGKKRGPTVVGSFRGPLVQAGGVSFAVSTSAQTWIDSLELCDDEELGLGDNPSREPLVPCQNRSSSSGESLIARLCSTKDPRTRQLGWLKGTSGQHCFRWRRERCCPIFPEGVDQLGDWLWRLTQERLDLCKASPSTRQNPTR